MLSVRCVCLCAFSKTLLHRTCPCSLQVAAGLRASGGSRIYTVSDTIRYDTIQYDVALKSWQESASTTRNQKQLEMRGIKPSV